ncbi:MAG: PASTA domain-containing protein [Caldicoprobacterales bacterium]|jgi:beta-lactam-binding protein with PASTA domain|nr:PASTA domain-containing protein [Clostridiales bacterium]
MDARNKFLESYKKKTQEQGLDVHIEGSPAEAAGGVKEGVPPEEEVSLKFEQKPGFIKPEPKPITPASRSSKKINRYVGITLGVVILLGIIIGTVLLFNRGVEVIDLVGWTENDAQLWAREKGVNLQVEKEYSDEVEAGKVISQSVAKGMRIKKGEFIKIVVSLGHDLSVTLPLPDLMSMTKEEIEAWAAENFMAKVRITAEHSLDVPVGRVIRYEINDDTVVDNEVSRNTPIYVIVSKGPEDEEGLSVTIPNFKEMALAESYIFANENGIVLIVEEEYDDYVPEGSIISQSIKAEEKVAKGTEITLVVSKGKMITIPDFSGYSKERATAVAGGLGIPITIKERYSSAPADTFISQSIKAGSEYKEGDILELVYSIDNKVVLSSFVGQTRDAIEAWAKELNDQGASITIKVTNTKSNSPKGTILYQDKSNTVIGIKTTINITVSQGKVIYVPDFVAPAGSGYDLAITREKAIAMCEELNIIPIFKEASKQGRLPGEVWSQSIEAGKEITEGSTITLKYVPANVKVTVPNFKGKTKEQILAEGHNKNFYIKFEEGTEYVKDYEGKVISQSPKPSTKAAAGSTITLIIGPAGMPDIPGEPESPDVD